MERIAALVSAWCARDHAHAALPTDHEVIDSTSASRALILELASAYGPSRDLFSACAVLGRLTAERGGSPTLATAAMDGAHEVLGPTDDTAWLEPARAALAEGYAAARQEMARREAASAWEYPRCAVTLEQGTVAIVAGYPSDDGDALQGWAARVAKAASLAGVRRAVVGGAELSRAAVVDALTLAGIEVHGSMPPSSPDKRPSSWLPWRR